MKFLDKKQYVIELDGLTYLYCKGKLESIKDMEVVQGDRWLVTDFETCISRTMTVEAPAKYAEVMVRKNIQETGEFDEAVSIITHEKKKGGPNTTDVFFTAVPTRIYQRYLEKVKDDKDNLLVLPLFLLLQRVLKKYCFSKTMAVVFHHGRFADLVVGTENRVYYANRCVAFDTSEEQITSLWETVSQDIGTAEKEHSTQVEKICVLNWVDTLDKPKLQEELIKRIIDIGKKEVAFEGEKRSISFLQSLRHVSILQSVSPSLEKISYFSRKYAPYFCAILFCASLVCLGGLFGYSKQSAVLKKNMQAIRSRIGLLEQKGQKQDFLHKDVLDFVKELHKYRNAPSFKQIINNVSENLPKSMSVEIFKVDYTEKEVKVELFGNATDSFEKSYGGYQGFIRLLEKDGFNVDESKFDTEIKKSEFLIKLSKSII